MSGLVRIFLCSFFCSLLLSSATSAGEGDLKANSGEVQTEVQMEEQWISMKDGVRLSVTLYLPRGVKTGEKFPVLLEYLPYRKDDDMAIRDYADHVYFSRRGYVGARVDIRGTGRSEGRVPEREYSQIEQEDALQVINWLAVQSWSTGKVGMFGISWGGFNSLQIAMKRPPELKAIMAVCSSDQLFHDDIHYVDGMLHIDEFALSMDLENGISPAPHFPVDEETLQNRFDTPPWTFLYLNQQRDGEFWNQGSLASDYSAIDIPVFMIGGLLDGYRDSIPRMLKNMNVPKKAIIGPWSHFYPHLAVPGPTIEWRAEAVRWWDHWLKGMDNGIMEEPSIQIYMRQWHAPDLHLETVPGYWKSARTWPPAQLQYTEYFLDTNRLLRLSPPSAEVREQLKYLPSGGLEAGYWWGDLTPDQSPADAKSLVYETGPLEDEIEILGVPEIDLFVSADAPQANWFVRLSDIAPDGTSSLITGGGINGAHRESANNPKALVPDKVYPLHFDLHFTTWQVPQGHRIRVAVSNALWPMIFPSPQLMTTSLYLGGNTLSKIRIPKVPVEKTLSPPPFAIPDLSDQLPNVKGEGGHWPQTRDVRQDKVNLSTLASWNGSYETQFPWGVVKNYEEMKYFVHDNRTDSSSVEGYAETLVNLPNRLLKWTGRLEFLGDLQHFYLSYTRQLFENGVLLRERKWNEKISRDHQ